jgi:hypothetical protein
MKPHQTIKPPDNPDDMKVGIKVLRKRLKLRRSEIVRMAAEEFIRVSRRTEETKPYDRVADIIGTVSSGIPDLGEAHRKYLLKR